MKIEDYLKNKKGSREKLPFLFIVKDMSFSSFSSSYRSAKAERLTLPIKKMLP